MHVRITVAKLVATVIACGYVVAMIVEANGATPNVVKGSLGLLLPMALIWFPDAIGGFTGYVGRGGRIDTETPPFLVSAAGWILLIGVPAAIYLLR